MRLVPVYQWNISIQKNTFRGKLGARALDAFLWLLLRFVGRAK